MPGIGLHMGQRLEQRLEQRLQIALPGLIEPFRTDEEQLQVSQYEILRELNKLIDNEGYIDGEHFDLEVNRTVFGHKLEARLGHFGRNISELVRFYQSDEELAKKIVQALSSQKEEAERKDIPGLIAGSWNKVLRYLTDESSTHRILGLVEELKTREADIAEGMSLVSTTSELGQQLTEATIDKVKEYAERDKRLIPFAVKTLAPITRAVRGRNESLGYEEAQALYKEVIESVYMLDRELTVPDVVDKVADAISRKGIKQVLGSQLPVAMQVYLEQFSRTTQERLTRLCKDESFEEGREVKRKVYKGLAAIDDIQNGEEILNHITSNATDSKSLARILAALNLIYRDSDFSYNFELQGEESILRNLRLQLVDKSIKRLELDDKTLDDYLTRVESDERFARIGTIVTTLAGYSHYNNPQQIGLLREVVQAELQGRFSEWKYSHDRTSEQLAVLGKDTESWKKKTKSTRLVGELDALKTHIDSVKNVLPKILETYEEYYGRELQKEHASELEVQIAQNEEQLRNEELPKRERNELGSQTSLLREHLAYVNLLSSLQELNTENYGQTLEKADHLIRKKSRNPLYENARWIRETLDQPVYREARKISVYEIDDLETLLRFGETPVTTCQNWKVNSTLNGSLLSFVADSNKTIYNISNGDGKPIARSMVRLVDWDGTPTLLAENVYYTEWNDDYGVALFGSLADKALAMYEETGKTVRIATTHPILKGIIQRFSDKYKVELYEDKTLATNPAHSKNTEEYWDSLRPGKFRSGTPVSFSVSYIAFGNEEGED